MVSRDYAAAAERLKSAGIEDWSFEARIIFEEIFGANFLFDMMMGRLDRAMLPEELEKLNSYIQRRISGEPLQYILGSWEFYGRKFYVGKGVLIPRQDTEVIVETAINLLKGRQAPKILDLCSGSGCIPITLSEEIKGSEAHAVELYDEAYSYLLKNNALYGGRVVTYRLDALLAESTAGFRDLDLITCNPPYLTQSDMDSLQTEVRYEPQTALYGGKDGLGFYRVIPKLWKNCLKSGGYMLFEIGCDQGSAVKEIMAAEGFSDVSVIMDYCGKDRVVLGKKAL